MIHFDVEYYPDARYQDGQTRWVTKDGRDVRQIYVSLSAGTGWIDQPYRLTFSEQLTHADISMVIRALYIVAGEAEEVDESAEALCALADRLILMELSEDDRVALDVARASLMTKSERLESFAHLFRQVQRQALPPSRYRKANELEIERLCAMARPLFWKES